MEWINTAIRSVWTNVGEIPDSVSGIPFAKLTKGERELCMKQAMFNLNIQGLDNEQFTGGMWDAILKSVNEDPEEGPSYPGYTGANVSWFMWSKV